MEVFFVYLSLVEQHHHHRLMIRTYAHVVPDSPSLWRASQRSSEATRSVWEESRQEVCVHVLVCVCVCVCADVCIWTCRGIVEDIRVCVCVLWYWLSVFSSLGSCCWDFTWGSSYWPAGGSCILTPHTHTHTHTHTGCLTSAYFLHFLVSVFLVFLVPSPSTLTRRRASMLLLSFFFFSLAAIALFPGLPLSPVRITKQLKHLDVVIAQFKV